VPNSGAVNYSGTVVGTSANPDVNRWILVGNPYPSPMVWNAPTGIEAIAKVYNVSGPYQGTYSDVTAGSVLAIGQGYSVRVGTAGAFNFSVDDLDRTVGTATWKSLDAYDHLITVDVLGNGFADQSTIFFSENSSQGFNPMVEDGAKRAVRAGQPSVYSIVDSFRLSTNGLPSQSFGSFPIPLGVNPGMNGQFALHFDGLHTLPNSSLVFLEDKALNTFTSLRENPVYDFSMTTSEAEDRFVLHFLPPVNTEVFAETCGRNDGRIVLDFGSNLISDLPISWDYSLMTNGIIVASGSSSGLVEINDLQPAAYNVTYAFNGFEISEQIYIDDSEAVNAYFVSSSAEVEIGETVDFYNQSTIGHSYTWLVNGDVYASFDLSYLFQFPGEYLVELHVDNGNCKDEYALPIIVKEKSTGLNESVDLSNVILYSFGQQIFIEATASSYPNELYWEVFNVLGQNISSGSLNEGSHSVNMLNESEGYYFIRLSNEDQTITRKLYLGKR
jgi:hypothetical protein